MVSNARLCRLGGLRQTLIEAQVSASRRGPQASSAVAGAPPYTVAVMRFSRCCGGFWPRLILGPYVDLGVNGAIRLCGASKRHHEGKWKRSEARRYRPCSAARTVSCGCVDELGPVEPILSVPAPGMRRKQRSLIVELLARMRILNPTRSNTWSASETAFSNGQTAGRRRNH